MSETPTPAEPEVSEEDGVEVKTPTYTPIFVTLSRECRALKSEIPNIQKQEYSFGIGIGATDDGRQVISKISGEVAKTLLRVGDEVMAIDDAPVSPTFSHPDLAAVLTHEGLMERIAAATTIKLTILREDADDEEEEVVPEVYRRMTVSAEGKEAPAEVIKEGELTKKGEIRKNWKTRWFVLYGKSIAYLDKQGGKVKGGILLEDANLIRDATELEAGKKEHCLVVELPERHYVISASSPEDKDAWHSAIAKVLLGLGKDPEAKSQSAEPNRKRVKITEEPPVEAPSAEEPPVEAPSAEEPKTSKLPAAAAVGAGALAVEAVGAAGAGALPLQDGGGGGPVTIGLIEEGVRDAASACTKAVDMLKNRTPQPFRDLLEPAIELNDMLPNITQFKLNGVVIPGMPDIVGTVLEAIDIAEYFIKKISDKIGGCIDSCWSTVDQTWGCTWALFTSMVTLPDLSILSKVGELIRSILTLFEPLIKAASEAAEALAQGLENAVGGLASGIIDKVPGLKSLGSMIGM